MIPEFAEQLARDGIAIIDNLLDEGTVQTLARLAEPLLAASNRRRPGVRRVLQREPGVGDVLNQSAAAELILAIGGPGCRVVRAIIFNKSPEANWLVPWHQDASIAVAERIDVSGFGPWAVKDGEHHCQPPLHILESIFTLRIHLDACPPESGPLRVVAGSHRAGLLDEPSIAECVRSGRIVQATTPRDGAVLTTPLAVHSSARSTDPGARRRVLHLDCSAMELPSGLRWAEAWRPGETALTPPASHVSDSNTAP